MNLIFILWFPHYFIVINALFIMLELVFIVVYIYLYF